MELSEKIDLFFANSDLTVSQKVQLIEIISNAWREGIKYGKEFREQNSKGTVDNIFTESAKWIHYN